MQPAIILSDQDTRRDLECSITNLRAAVELFADDPERRERYTAAINEALDMWRGARC